MKVGSLILLTCPKYIALQQKKLNHIILNLPLQSTFSERSHIPDIEENSCPLGQTPINIFWLKHKINIEHLEGWSYWPSSIPWQRPAREEIIKNGKKFILRNYRNMSEKIYSLPSMVGFFEILSILLSWLEIGSNQI